MTISASENGSLYGNVTGLSNSIAGGTLTASDNSHMTLSMY